MKILDEVKIQIKSGKGGNGSNSFRREKYVEFGGPDGGNGGKGGDIIFMTNESINTLANFRFKKFFEAKSGECGRGKNMTGHSGEDRVLKVPVGTQIFDETGEFLLLDLFKKNQVEVFLKGGRGGAGNACFKSSINQSPKNALPGQEGSEMTVWVKLKILSDVGIIGLPNAGKSSLISVISNAKPKIADFPFTTLSPNLGMVSIKDNEIVFCDIPGLIEGAHLGHGLGDKFLKHIERCKILVHLIDISQNIIENFDVIANEILLYSKNLSNKPMIIVFNKIDLIDKKDLDVQINKFVNHIINSKYFKETNWFSYINLADFDSISALKIMKENIYKVSTFNMEAIDILLDKVLEIHSTRNKID